MIWIGTSGYSFDHWHRSFYPADLPRGQRLDFYVQHFQTVEVNSTYYRIPHPAVMRQMERKTPAGFRFIVKVHQDVTHKSTLDPDKTRAFLEVVAPLEEAGKFHGLLAQFPWSFERTLENVDHLRRVREAMGERPVFVEFRNASWARRETFRDLREAGLGFCAVDEPRLRGLFPPIVEETNGTGYVRFHGRNAAQWWSREPGQLRYDYDYSDDELSSWIGAIRELGSRTTDTYLFFNNCHAGRAARNARRMSELLGLEGI